MASSDLYTFVDSTGALTEISADQLNFLSAWSAKVFYNRFDVVTYNNVQYACLKSNQGQTPPASAQFTPYWSLVVLTGGAGTQSGGGTGGGTTGTVPAWVLEWIGQTYTIATSGTNTANSALTAASAAQSAASAAQSTASSAVSTANNAQSTASTALSTANTLSSSVDAANATANSAQSTANSAVAQISSALTLAAAGTNAANAAWAYAGQAYTVATAGTIAANRDWAYAGQAYTIATAGTAAAAAASSLARTALTTAWSGTNRGKSMVFCAGYTPQSVGADAAELVVPYSPSDGVTSLTWATKRLVMRVQTAGSQSDVVIEKSSGNGVFNAVSVGTLTLPFGAYESFTVGSLASVNSGDKMRFNILNLGSAQNWTVIAEIGNP